MYHKCLSECMHRMSELKKIPGKEQRVGIMVASHNADTVRFAIERLVEILMAKVCNDVGPNSCYQFYTSYYFDILLILTLYFRMKQLGIKGDERLICFGQLLGMCDNLTFPLGMMQ